MRVRVRVRVFVWSGADDPTVAPALAPPWNIEVIRITWIRKQRLLVSTRITFAKLYEIMKVQEV